jgi:hypothetical protein
MEPKPKSILSSVVGLALRCGKGRVAAIREGLQMTGSAALLQGIFFPRIDLEIIAHPLSLSHLPAIYNSLMLFLFRALQHAKR